MAFFTDTAVKTSILHRISIMTNETYCAFIEKSEDARAEKSRKEQKRLKINIPNYKNMCKDIFFIHNWP
jgi:hypothetical protein